VSRSAKSATSKLTGGPGGTRNVVEEAEPETGRGALPRYYQASLGRPRSGDTEIRRRIAHHRRIGSSVGMIIMDAPPVSAPGVDYLLGGGEILR